MPGSSVFTWTPMCSMTAVKYQRYGAVEMKPFLPGERKRCHREMERNMKGYKEVMQEINMMRKTMDQQEKARHGVKKTLQTSYYKSPVGTRSASKLIILFLVMSKPSQDYQGIWKNVLH